MGGSAFNKKDGEKQTNPIKEEAELGDSLRVASRQDEEVIKVHPELLISPRELKQIITIIDLQVNNVLRMVDDSVNLSLNIDGVIMAQQVLEGYGILKKLFSGYHCNVNALQAKRMVELLERMEKTALGEVASKPVGEQLPITENAIICIMKAKAKFASSIINREVYEIIKKESVGMINYLIRSANTGQEVLKGAGESPDNLKVIDLAIKGLNKLREKIVEGKTVEISRDEEYAILDEFYRVNLELQDPRHRGALGREKVTREYINFFVLCIYM